MQACRELRPGLDGLMQQEAVDAAEWLGSAQLAVEIGSLRPPPGRRAMRREGEGKFKFHHQCLHVEPDIEH